MKGHKGHHKKASGGRTGLVAAGNPDVLKEAEGKEDYAKGDERKRGGRAKKKNGGKGEQLDLSERGNVITGSPEPPAEVSADEREPETVVH